MTPLDGALDKNCAITCRVQCFPIAWLLPPQLKCRRASGERGPLSGLDSYSQPGGWVDVTSAVARVFGTRAT